MNYNYTFKYFIVQLPEMSCIRNPNILQTVSMSFILTIWKVFTPKIHRLQRLSSLFMKINLDEQRKID